MGHSVSQWVSDKVTYWAVRWQLTIIRLIFFGRMSWCSLYHHFLGVVDHFDGRGIFAHIYCSLTLSLGDNTKLRQWKGTSKGTFYLRHKREIFCKIKTSSYFVTFINDSDSTMVFNISWILAPNQLLCQMLFSGN